MTDPIRILVDADACPVKEEIYKVAFRMGVPVFIVANKPIRTPRHELIMRITVDDHMDAADDWIVNEAGEGAIVITADILLADRALKKGAVVVRPNGRFFDDASIGSAVATRAILNDLRAGADMIATANPPSFKKEDRSRFLSALDETITQLRRA